MMEFEDKSNDTLLDISNCSTLARPTSINSANTFTTYSSASQPDTEANKIDLNVNFSATVANNYPQNINPCNPSVFPMEFGILSEHSLNGDPAAYNIGGYSRVLTQINDNRMVTPPLSASVPATIMQPGKNTDTEDAHWHFDHKVNPCSTILKPPVFMRMGRLEITEQPMDKFRFRYKSEMNGTHGALHGCSAQRLPKTYPEVRLCDFDGEAVIRCTLFQVNVICPHSHQLIVRREEKDLIDPHEISVSRENGYLAKFMNMGIIHTAKRHVVTELLRKKRIRLISDLNRELSPLENQELYAQCEREAKDMNLNQVRLCFEAFIYAEDRSRIPIAAPVFSKIVSNRKSALAGELRITRLSTFAGSVMGGDDLILLVEKVSKKNIKVRFYEMFEDDLVWEGYAKFRETDVHHQYAIVCKTPPYKNPDIENAVEVHVELVRPSDDEHSTPVTFRYKPREILTCRKRRHSNSTPLMVSNSDSSGCSSGGRSFLGSDELPRSILEENNHPVLTSDDIFEELEQLLNNKDLKKKITSYTDSVTIPDLLDYLQTSEFEMKQKYSIPIGRTEKDGIVGDTNKHIVSSMLSSLTTKASNSQNSRATQDLESITCLYLSMRRIFSIYSVCKRLDFVNQDEELPRHAEKEIATICRNFTSQNDTGDSLLHEIILNDDHKLVVNFCEMLEFFKMQSALNTDFINCKGQNVLHYACLYNRPQYIRSLLRLGCNPNHPDRSGNTPLHMTVLEKNIGCLTSLLNNGTDLKLDVLNDEGFNVLHLAIRSNSLELVKLLIDKDKNLIDVVNITDGGNALHLAIQQEQEEMMKLFLETGVSEGALTTKNAAGSMPLHLAQKISQNVSSSSCNILQMLIVYLETNHICKDQVDNVAINQHETDKDESDEDELVIDEDLSEASDHDDANVTDRKCAEELNSTPIIIDEVILLNALSNRTTFNKLEEILERDDLWRQLAIDIDMDHFFLLRAQGLLNWMKRSVRIVNYKKLNPAIRELSKEAYNLIIQP